MNRNDLIGLRNCLKNDLPPLRYEHTVGVAYTAACMAMCFGIDHFKAELAGLMHDCAKQYSEKEILSKCLKDGIKLSDEVLQAPQVLHAIYGPVVASKKYGIEDEQILSAIRWHTTGKANMTDLDMIVYIADYIEPGRYKSLSLPSIRIMAFKDLKRTTLRITEDTLEYLNTRGHYVDAMTQRCYNWLKEEDAYD